MRRLLPFLLLINMCLIVIEGYAQPCNCLQMGTNLIVNGDFEDPGTVSSAPLFVGFETDYSITATTNTFGMFRWLTNPQSVNSCCWCFQAGSNHMLIFDATTRAGLPTDAAVAPYDVLRYANIPVVKGATYYFSFDGAHLAPSYPAAVLSLRINGQFLSSYTLSNPCSNWQKYEYCWVADTNVATVVLNEETSQFYGHDFAIDNLYFGHCILDPVILNGDSTALDTTFCYEAINHSILGVPAGGTFSGCGISSIGGTWYFNPAQAASGSSGWPHRCPITYTLPGGERSSREMTVRAPVAVDLGSDTTACDSVLLRVRGTYANATYLWSNGANTSEVMVAHDGIHWLRVTEQGCVGSDTIEVSLSPTPVIDLGPDTIICAYDLPYLLSSPQPLGAQYLWSNGFSDPTMVVTRSGDYWLHVNNKGCTSSDTIVIEVVSAPDVYLGDYQVICASVPAEIGMAIPGGQYLWNTGATTSHIRVNETGVYWLEVNVRGCKGIDSIYILAQPDPIVDLGPDGNICGDEEIVLDAGNGGAHYYWSTGSRDRVLRVNTAGLYHVTVLSPDSCIGRDSILLTYIPDPVVQLGIDTTVCEETPLLLRPFAINAESLLWSDGSSGDMLQVTHGGVYTVSGFNDCGSDSDTIEVRQIFCDIWVPNVFTPNSDGKNDVFRVLGNVGRIDHFGLSIFDRWGQRVFYTSDKYQGWDGVYNGAPCMMGTFVYMLEYHIDGKPFIEKGNFHLLR